MAKQNQFLKLAMKSVFQINGFTFKKGTWIRSCREVEQRVQLGKSPHGEQYYLDVSIDIRKKGAPVDLLTSSYHCRFRMDETVDPEFEVLLDFWTDADTEQLRQECKEDPRCDAMLIAITKRPYIPPEERETRMRHLLTSKAMPILDELVTVSALRDAYLYQRIKRVIIPRDVSMYIFGVEPAPRPLNYGQNG